jgi:hypothetical protein
MKDWFPGYNMFRKMEKEAVTEELRSLKCFEKNIETGKYEWSPQGPSNFKISADTEEGLVDAVIAHREQMKKRSREIFINFRNSLKEAIKNGSVEGIEFSKIASNYAGLNKDWFKLQMKKYANKNWKVLDGEKWNPFIELNLLPVLNINTGLIDFIKLSTSPITNKKPFGKNHTTLAGAFKSDLFYSSNSNSLMLQSVYGNIELMEAMIAINKMHGIFGNNTCIGGITVYNPIYGTSVPASNSELLYCFNELYRLKPLKDPNHFSDGSIKMANKYEIARTRLADIMALGQENGWNDKYYKFKDFTSCKS